MNTNQNSHQFGQSSKIDKRQNIDSDRREGTEESINQKAGPSKNDDDFLSGDNAPRQNPNIGGNENEYDITNADEDRYDEETIANNDSEERRNPHYGDDFQDDGRNDNEDRDNRNQRL
jgi:hypothetical protein